VVDLQLLERLNVGISPLLYGSAILALIAETWIMARRHIPRDKKSRWLGIQCGLLAFGVEGVVNATVLVALQFMVYEHRLFDPGTVWWVWPLCFLINDVMFYVSHRLSHEIRLFWAVHVVHHSPRHYDLTTGIRGSALGGILNLPFVVWIPILGIHPLVFLIVNKLFKFYGLAYHTEAVGSLGWVDRVLVTPSNHRVHHAKDPHYLDRNYGGFFILFDRLLGTFTPESTKPTFGIVKDWHGYGLVDCQVHEFRSLWEDLRGAQNWRERWHFLFGPPGWRPEPMEMSTEHAHI
jgi:sterol desaturase/sphingolipid hydroxylase (fatty acid hydroxylase superfamily)